ncbi:hypothetical protein COY26_05680 [Candidatus Woesearchaeota archaeon CG_4_10_14_0_2_um_filter_33_10]|nr:MAG: hypothetical protein COY26_05680 [Candidatus Woesearchaeota archaeon CG_4_10_14_0_2_um_filter_33_10]
MACEITLIKSNNCPHCQSLLSKIPKETSIKVIDIDTPEAKIFNATEVPSAFVNKIKCSILVDDKTFYLDCPENAYVGCG